MANSNFTIRLATTVDESGAREQLEKLIKELQGDPVKLKVETGDVKSDLSQMLKDLEKLKSVAEEVKIGGSNSGSEEIKEQTTSALSEFKKLTNEYNALQKQMAKETNPKSLEVLKKQLNEVGTSIKQVESKMSEADKAMAKSFSDTSARKLETAFTKTFSNISSQAETLGDKIEKAFKDPNFDTSGLEKIKKEYESLQDSLKNFDLGNATGESMNGLLSDLNKVQTEFKNLSAVAENTKLENKFNIDCSKAISELEQLKSQYESLGKDSSGIDSMINDINRLSSEVGSVDLGKLRSELDTIKTSTANMKKEVGNAGSFLSSTFSDFAGSLSAFTLGNLAGDALSSALYGVKDTILDLDNAFRDLQKVAPDSFKATEAEFENIRVKAADMANEVGTSATDMINATSSALQLGIKNIDDAMEYGKNVNLFANVSDQSTDQADTQLKGILSAYGGINEALKTNQGLVKGATPGYNEMINLMDQLNFAGQYGSFSLNCWNVLRAY